MSGVLAKTQMVCWVLVIQQIHSMGKKPLSWVDATNNSITCNEVSCIAISDARGYQGYGNTRVMVILHDGRVMSWGWGGSGAHGLGNTTNTSIQSLVD